MRKELSGASWSWWAARVERVQKWVRSSSRAGYLRLRVQIEDVVVIGFAQCDGEPPVQVVVVV